MDSVSLQLRLDDILNCLEELENHGYLSVTAENQIQTLKFELRFLSMHVKWNGYFIPFALDTVRTLVTDVEMRLLQPTRKGSMAADLLEETLSSLLQRMEPGKDIYNMRCLHLNYAFQEHKFAKKERLIDELVMELVDPLLKNLKHLIRCNDLKLLVFPKEQIEALVEKLRSLRNFLEITGVELEGVELEDVIKTPRQGLLHKTSEDLLTHIKMLIGNAIYLSYDLWARPEQGRMEKLIFDLLVRINHIEPEIRMIFVQLMKASKTANLGTLGIDLQALAAVDSLLDNLQKLIKNQDTGSFMHLDVHQIEFLHQELSFLKCFLMDPHLKQYNETEPQSLNSLLIQVEAMAREGASLTHSICVGQTKDHIADAMNMLHSNLLNVVNLLKAKIRQMYLRVPKPSPSSFLQTPNLGFLDFFLQSLEELLKHRADSIAFVKNEIEIVRTELRFLSTFVRNTIKKPEEDEHIARRVVAVACEAECVIDLISANHFPRWYHMLWLSDVIEKIKMLRKDSTEVCSMKTCDISVLNVEKASIHDPPQAYTLAAEEELVGFNDEAGKIIDQLTKGPKELDIVSIVGMPGLGKTTLANKVYKDPSITMYFHVRSWYCISQVYERRKLLLSILSDVIQLTEKILKMDDEDIAQELYKSLKGRRYLIVLDDIWSTEPWDDIHNSFPDDCNWSRILFTSRQGEVALKANPRTRDPHRLPFFTDEECWELLLKKVFKQRSCPSELYKIGKQIAKNCKGLPLSVVVVAGILSVEESEDHWKHVSESLGQVVGDSSKYIVELSYKHLPDHLKPCFLYLGAFPEDTEIPTRKLIRLWIADGLVRETNSESLESLENVAEGYLMDLIARSLVFMAQNKSNGGVKSCRLHDILREFSLNKTKDENFFQISKEMVNPEQYRHYFHCKEKSLYTWMPYDPYVRSVGFFPTDSAFGSIFGLYPLDLSVLPYILKLLRVLDLERVTLGSKFPIEIGFLVHLRYLAVRGEMDRVPSSIGNLWRLETLLVKGSTRGVKLPETLLKLAHLKHVYVENRAAFQLSDNFQPEKSFPCIRISGPLLCHGDVNSEKVIGCLQSLRKLKCIFLGSRYHSSCNNPLPVLDSLSELESLNVTYDGVKKGPLEFCFPSKLKKLTLSEFRLPWTEISKIGRLRQLEVLKLLSWAFEGRRWDVSDDEFRNLKFLKLEGLDIVEWDASSAAFPCLEQLVLRRCAKLEEIPSSFGELVALRTIEVRWCSDSATKAMREIQKEQEDLGSDGLKVLIQSS